MSTLTHKMLATLKSLAKSDGLPSELAELALSPDAEIPTGVLETLTGIMDGFAKKSDLSSPDDNDQN